MKKFEVLFYNRFANQMQIFRVIAKNEFRAGRLFYLKHNRKSYHDCIEMISEGIEKHFLTEEEIRKSINP